MVGRDLGNCTLLSSLCVSMYRYFICTLHWASHPLLYLSTSFLPLSLPPPHAWWIDLSQKISGVHVATCLQLKKLCEQNFDPGEIRFGCENVAIYVEIVISHSVFCFHLSVSCHTLWHLIYSQFLFCLGQQCGRIFFSSFHNSLGVLLLQVSLVSVVSISSFILSFFLFLLPLLACNMILP